MPSPKPLLTDTLPTDLAALPASMPTLILGILSIVLGFVPVIGLGLGTAGSIIGALHLRKLQYTQEGYRVIARIPWSRVPGVTQAGVILSLLGVIGGAFVTVIGGIIIVTIIVNSH